MKTYIFTLTFLCIVYNVSASWKLELIKHHISYMESFITKEHYIIEAEKKAQPKGQQCFDSAVKHLEDIMDAYHVKIASCVKGDVNQEDATRCCSKEQINAVSEVGTIVNEAVDCIYDSMSTVS